MRKRIKILLLTCMLCLISAGCGENKDEPVPEPSPNPINEASVTEIPEEKEEYVIPDITVDTFDVPDTEGMRFVRELGIGVNLGNTFDSYSDKSLYGLPSELSGETQWVSVETTQEIIDAYADAGFTTIRIPVSWHQHVDEQFNISDVWLSRVEEVVNYALNRDMHVIINIHHDFEEDYIYPSSEYYESSYEYLTKIWSQVSERFKDYDNRVIFESMNEPRLVGHPNEWWIQANADCNDAIKCINDLNQAFVDTVRKSGGNNSERFIMVPGYDASVDGACNTGFVIPEDSAEDRLIISIHAYTPYDFALSDSDNYYFTEKQKNCTGEIDSFMDKLYKKFVSKGVPVLIGEFGARNKKFNTQYRINFAAYYVASARARGMSALWWDNNCFSGTGEQFGLLYRRGNYFVYPEIVEAMTKYGK